MSPRLLSSILPRATLNLSKSFAVRNANVILSRCHQATNPLAVYLTQDVPFQLISSRDKTSLRLSDSQASMLQGWLRPDQALPPPNVNVTALNQASYRNLKPTMRRADRTDLVQDAATDCSLVASLCAAVARAEKGHPRVSNLPFIPFCWIEHVAGDAGPHVKDARNRNIVMVKSDWM